jgi:hypothetical protein
VTGWQQPHDCNNSDGVDVNRLTCFIWRRVACGFPRNIKKARETSIKLELTRDLLQQVLRAKNCKNSLRAGRDLRKRMM